MSKAAYSSAKTLAEAGVMGLTSAVVAVEDLVLGPSSSITKTASSSQHGRTPEEIAQEWRQKKRIKEAEARVTGDSDNAAAADVGGLEGCRSYHTTMSSSSSDDSDDTPIVVNNQKSRLNGNGGTPRNMIARPIRSSDAFFGCQ